MNREIDKFHKMAYLLAALAHGAENNLGKATDSIAHMAGKKFGKEAAAGCVTTSDPAEALGNLLAALRGLGIIWEVEPFPGSSGELVREDGDRKRMRVVFRTCMVRNALFRYAHDQKQSLCHMAHGVFAGGMEMAMPGNTVDLEILQACPNACLKELVWREKK